MTYSLLKDIGLIPNQLPDNPAPFNGNDELPIITVSPPPFKPREINTNNDVTSLSTLFHKMSRDAENISMFQPRSQYENRHGFQPRVSEEYENVSKQDMKCTDVFDHIKSCKVCSKLYKEDHLPCESCNHSQQQTDDEGKTDYKPACIILSGVCIILFLIILKLLIGKNN